MRRGPSASTTKYQERMYRKMDIGQNEVKSDRVRELEGIRPAQNETIFAMGEDRTRLRERVTELEAELKSVAMVMFSESTDGLAKKLHNMLAELEAKLKDTELERDTYAELASSLEEKGKGGG